MKEACLLNYDTLTVGKEHRLYLLVKVEGPEEEKGREPLPINLSVVVDRSGSMQGDKLEYVKKAAKSLVRKLGKKDRLSVVSYGHEVRVELPPAPVTDPQRVEQIIEDIQIRGNTNLSGGWLQGCDFVDSGLSEQGVNRVLLLTDGLANEGITDPTRLAAAARGKRTAGVTTTCFGVGMSFNEDLLTRMSSEGGGSFYFIDRPDQAPTFFAEELSDLYSVVGQNLAISLTTASTVRGVTQLYDYPHHHQEEALVYRLGDLYAEEERHQVLELSLRELAEGETRLGTITVAYDAVGENGVVRRESTHEIVVRAVPEGELEVKLPVVEVEKLALLQKVRQARARSVELADRRAFEEAREVLRAMAAAIKASGIEDEELKDEYDLLLEEAMDMEFGEERFNDYSRKLTSSKVASASRSDRFSGMTYDSHLRHKLGQRARERGGPAPRVIRWREGSLRLEGEEITIGTDRGNEITLRGEGVEPQHCRLKRLGEDWDLVDLSTGGTLANGGRVAGVFQLSAGDLIRVGRVVLRLE